MKESTIIFEKNEDYFQKLTFVITTKNEELIELLHSIIHVIMDRFVDMFKDLINQDFNGLITMFRNFDRIIEEIRNSYGFDVLNSLIKIIDMGDSLKSVILIEPKGGNVLYTHAKQYIDKEKISFLVPLILNSAQLLYHTNLNENIISFLLNTVRNENLIVEKRDKILIVKQYLFEEDLEDQYLSLEFFMNRDRYIKKPKKLINIFEKIKWDSRLKQVYLVDLFGKVIYSKLFDSTYDFTDYIPETISFVTSSKNASEQIYNRTLFYSSVFGDKIVTICINFNNFALTMMGNLNDLVDFSKIKDICIDIFNQLK